MREVDTLVIGAGPGGYVAAIRLGQLGVDTLLVEREFMGGVCLNVGCIPSKALIHAGHTLHEIQHADQMGFSVGDVAIDAGKLQAWKGEVVGRLTGGVSTLCKANGVAVTMGSARFTTDRSAEITAADGSTEQVSFRHAVIATGSQPIELPPFPFDEKRILSSTGALALTEIPRHLVVIGGGYIGLELGMMWRKFGAEVTVVELSDSLLPGFDKEAVTLLSRKAKKQGIRVLLNSMATKQVADIDGLKVTVRGADGAEQNLSCDRLLVTVGRRPSVAGLGLEDAGLAVDGQGFVPIDDQGRTAQPHIFAIGDVSGQPMLAHRASKQGEIVAEVIAGKRAGFDWKTVPAVVFTDPEIASVGMSQTEAEAAGYKVQVGKFPFAANGRAISTNEAEGFVKLFADAADGQILGGIIAGPQASTMISELALAIEMGALAQDLSLTIHPHPTLSEAVMEAAANVLGHAVHTVNR